MPVGRTRGNKKKADAGREQMLARMEEKLDANTKSMQEDIKSGQAEMRSIVWAIEEMMDTWIANVRDDRIERTSCQEIIACHEATETNTEKIQSNPRVMQSVAEHQEVSKEDAAVMPVGGLGKRRRDRNLAAEHRQKPMGRIQANFESRRRLTVAGRKITPHSRVAWHR
jgi:hypothetical protein